MRGKKVLVVGWDSAAPQLVFDRFWKEMRNFRKLCERGAYGELRSCDPPITIPAWACMVTSANPGRLGLYGFRHRRDNSYTEIEIPSSRSLREKKIWDYLAEKGRKSCLIAIPPSYPPYRVNGWLISCFMTPDTNRDYTYPRELREEIESLVGEYIIDVKFRREDRENVLREIFEMTERRFRVAEYLLEEKPWDFFMLVEIGLDRVQHAFWKYFDEEHHLYEPNSKFRNAIRDYYLLLDRWLGRFLNRIDDDTLVFVVSDHGAKRMKGAFCINQWLAKQGYLRLRDQPKEMKSLEELDVDWERTIAWGWGGYYARIFLNVRGREEKGVIDPKDYERVREELARKLREIRGPNGELWNTKVYKPEELYPEVRGNPPDLIVYFDDLYWRSAGTLGHPTDYLPENDTGPDDAVHDHYGIIAFHDPKRDLGGTRIRADILDVAPTIMRLMGYEVPGSFEGRVIEDIMPEQRGSR